MSETADSKGDLGKSHALEVEHVRAALGTDLERGLSAQRVQELRAVHGVNRLTSAPPTPMWRKFLRQFNELVIWILIGGAVLSIVLAEWMDAIVILAIVVLNGLLGFLQEERAGRALAALRKLSSPHSKVMRDGRLQVVEAHELVPGDRIELEAGDRIPADARLIDSAGFRVHEAALTGESEPADKDHAHVHDADTALGDRRNMVYMGTAAAAGKASALVVLTGMNTELGRIAGMVHSPQVEPTPLQKRLSQLGKVLIGVCLAIVAIIFVLQIVRGEKVITVLLLAVSLAVAAVPEGLPAIVTIALALGLHRMVRRNALIRKLPSVETLGSVTVICTDKTGTLTRNEMTVRGVFAGNSRVEVSGVGYVPSGEFVLDGAKIEAKENPDLRQVLMIGAYCNHAQFSKNEKGAIELIGDPTEGALLSAAMKAGIGAGSVGRIVFEIPFDSGRKTMSVVREDGPTRVMYSKGAPEVILGKCTGELFDGTVRELSNARREEIALVARELGKKALRVLALAYREYSGDVKKYVEEVLVFAGLVGMIDPPREEAKAAVAKCAAAGIRPVMITGDHPETALAIAREIGIARADDSNALSGRELEAMDDSALAEAVDRVSVYARVTPEHKLRVVRALQARGQIVAMTGDGVNDAPAVKAADIGIAMGISGTDVTKEASDMVLTDDNFASIVNAVEEGRGIFDNIQKFVHYLLASNTSEVALVFFAALVGWPAPLAAIHLLWINLITDGLPALALGVERPEPDIMCRPPRSPGERFITLGRGMLILAHGILMASVAAIGFGVCRAWGTDHAEHAQTVAFCIVTFTQLAFSFACRSQRYTLPQLGLLTNRNLFLAIAGSMVLQFAILMMPVTRRVFKLQPITGAEWVMIVGLALVPVTVIEVVKLARAWWNRGTKVPLPG